MVGMRAKVTLDVDTSRAKRSMDRAAAELNRSINGVGKKQISFNVNGKSFTQPLGRITASANEFTKSLEASNARVIAFGASVGILNGISEAFKALVVETVKFEKVLQDINVIVGASAGKLQEFGDGLFNVARNTAQAFSVSAEAALEFSRQGLTMEETLRRTNDALILTRLTGLDAADAVSGLTAAVNAFGDAGLSTTDIIDKLAAVDVKFAVSSEDLIKALERTGAVAIDAGVEIDSLIGLVTALQQTTARGGAVIGNGLKTIFTRIQRPESIRQLEEIGIAVKNLSGSILPADKIMINMAKSFDNLSQSQKSNIVQFSAGIFQANVFRAALRDLGKEQSIQAQATEIAGNAAGDAAQKNEMLNKTMAAMASQTSTSIQELAEILGTIGLAPDIDFFLSSIKDGIDGIKNTLGGGEDEGSVFAKGLVKGIGNVITGPAALAFGAIFIKLFVNIAKFARTSLKDVLGIASEKDKIRAMEESILKALGENVKLQEGLSNLENDRKAQEMFILGIIEKQNSAMSEQVFLASRLARPLVRAGINADFSQNEASGMVPVAASGMIPESSKKKERQGAAQGGYAAGAIDSMNVKGVGTVVYNKAEKVKQFPGMSQPAIMPPKESRAGKGYKDAFAGQHGFDPYASSGFVPNFAAMNGGKLMLDPSLTQLSANPESVKGSRNLAKSYAELEATGQPISVEATTKQLLSNSGGSHSKKVKEVIRYLQDEGGLESIERKFKLKKLPKRGKRTDDQAEADVLKAEGGKYFNTGGRSGDPTFPVDLVGLGMNPIEVKSGEWKLPNVLLKSLRLYSDDGLMRFAESQGATEEMINEARNEKFKKGANLLTKKGLIGKDASSEQTHQALLAHRMSEGLVPNFAKRSTESWSDRYEKNKDKKFSSLKEMSKAYGVKSITSAMNMSGAKKELGDRIEKLRTQVTNAGGRQTYDQIYENLKGGKYDDIKDLSEDSGRAKDFAEQMLIQGKKPTRIQTKAKKDLGNNFEHFKELIRKLKGPVGHAGTTIRNNNKRGEVFEKILSSLGGVAFEKTPDAMDFSRSKERELNVREEIAKKIGLEHPKTYGDAESGSGHGIKLMRDKLIRELHEGKLLEGLLLNEQVKLPGEQFPDIVNDGADSSRPSNITLEKLMKPKGLKSVKAREAINDSIKTNHGYTYDELLVEPKNEKKLTREENKRRKIKEQLDKKIISFNYVTDDIDLKKLDGRWKETKLVKEGVKELEDLTSGNVSGGLIPNFADSRTRSQKIQDTLADPSNKGIKFNKPPSPANITSAQISRQLDIPIGKTPETQPSDEDIKNAINAVAQTREKLQLPGYENLKSIDKTKILKKYKKQAGEGEYYGNKDLSAAKGFIPNYKKLYQAYVGSDGSGSQGVRENRNNEEWYYDNQTGADKILEDWTRVKANLPIGKNIQDMYSREYSITDKNLNQMTSGVYDAGNLKKLRVISRAFEANNELPNQNDEEWEEDYLNTGGDGWEEAHDEMEGRLGAYSRLRKTQKQDFLWKDAMAGTKTNPQPLASYEKNKSESGYVMPHIGNDTLFGDGFTNKDGDKIRSIFSPNLNKDNHLVERKLTDEYLDNQNFAKDVSQATRNPEKAMNAARQRGMKSIGDHMNSEGLIPNFADLSKSKRLKSFQGEYEDLAKMGSPLASWALKTIKDKEFQMIGNGMESWAIGNEEVVYKLPRPQIDSFSKTGDLELKRWRKQMKVMAQPSLQYEVGPENKAWNLVPDSNIAKRAERIRSQLDSSGIDSLFLPNTEVLKVAGQDEFITSQERVKGSTFFNLQNEILKNPKNKSDFNLDGYKIVEHLMENIGESTMIRDVHSGNFIAEASKKKQLLSTVNQFAPVESKQSKHLSGLGLRGLPDDSIAAIDFSSGLIPNFANNWYDFDETLATYPDTVTSADLFNAESAALAEPTDLAKSLKGKTLDILTARARESKPFISNKLKSWGINSGRIITTGSIQNGQTSAQKKAMILQNMQKKNGGQYNLIDDAPENIAAIKALGNRNLMGKLYSFSGQHAGRGSGNAEGLVPNFSKVERVQKSQKARVKEQITEEDKDLAHNIFDYLKTNISNLSSRFRFNRSTVSFGGDPEDYEKVFNHSSSRKNKENLIEIARSEMRMNRILKGFMIPHNEGVATARGKHKAPRDPFLDGAMHGGLVPNFADPLSAAISRERAAGVPQARIRVEKSSQLKSAQNPMGLAVTNTRDEPAGVQQGIRRAKTMGINPKKHGASKGMVPNFADPQMGGDSIQKIQNAINPLVEENLGSLKKIIENIGNAAVVFGDEFSEDIKKASKSLKESFNMDKLADELQVYIQHAEDSIKKIKEKPNKSEKDNKDLAKLNKFKSESGSALSGMGGLKEAKELKSSVKKDSTWVELRKVEEVLLKRSNKAEGENFKSIIGATKASQDFRIAMDESARSAEESQDDGGGLQRLFYLQSAISLVNGQFETLAEGASGLTKTFAQGMLAISNVTASYIQQKELVSEGMSMAGVKRDEAFSLANLSSFSSDSEQGKARKRADAKARGASVGKGPLGKMGGLMRNLSGVGRMFGRFLPIVGQLYTGFTVVNEAFKMITSIGNIGELLNLEKGAGIMDLLSTQGERAAKKLEKLGESTEKLQGALEGLNSQAENREKVTDLEILGSRRTQKQELELQQLKLKGLDIDIKAQDALSGLLDESLVGTKVSKRFIEELSKGTNSNEDYVKTIQEVIKVQKQQAAFLTGSKSFADLIDKKLDKFTAGSGDAEFLQGAAKVRGSQIGMGLSSVAAGSEDMDVKDRLAILNRNIQALEKESSIAAFNFGDMGDLTKRLTKNLQGTESFDASMMAHQVDSFMENMDESINNIEGMEGIETTAFNAGMKQIVAQLNKFKKNLEGESDRQQEAQLKKEHVTAYKNIIFNIEQFRKNEAHLTKLSLASLAHQDKLNSSQQSLLLEYGAIGKEAAISSDFARKRNAMEAKFIADKQGVEMKTIESLNKLRDTYFNTDQLAQEFKKDGEEAAGAVEALKENIKKGVSAADFAGIGKSMNLNPEVMAKVTEAFEQTSAETKNATSSLEVISSLLNKFGKATDGSTASALLLALHEKKLVTLTDEHLNLLRSGLLSRERQLEYLNTGNKEAQQLLKLEEEHKFIKEKTVAGAAKLYNILEARGREEKHVLDSVKGEAATLAVLNDFYKKDVSILAKSVDVMELGFQKQEEKNRTDAASAIHSLRMLEAQAGSLKISNDSLIILEAKLDSEKHSAVLALQESQFRLEYLSDQSKRSKLVELQLAKEKADLQTSNLLAAEKNLQLSKGKTLSELVSEQLNATLHSSRLEALTAAENALLLTGKTKQVKLIQEANELQEASNKLTELQNAVTKAGVSDKTLRMTTTADIGIEKANSILGTRTAGMKATVEPNAENMLAYANSLEQTNKLLGNGSRVMDRFRTKMAEINVEAENLSADLVDIGIDNARSGLKQMFDDIGSGAKSAKEAWNDFGLGLAKTLLDRMTQNNIDKIVKNLTFAFTGEEGKSDAEKIASETAHLVGVNNKIISSNLELISAINGQTTALKNQIDSEAKVDTPYIKKIPENTARGEDTLGKVASNAAKIEKELAVKHIKEFTDFGKQSFSTFVQLARDSFSENFGKPGVAGIETTSREAALDSARKAELDSAREAALKQSDPYNMLTRYTPDEKSKMEVKKELGDERISLLDQEKFHRQNFEKSGLEENEQNKKQRRATEEEVKKIQKSIPFNKDKINKILQKDEIDPKSAKLKIEALTQTIEKAEQQITNKNEAIKNLNTSISNFDKRAGASSSKISEHKEKIKSLTDEYKKLNTAINKVKLANAPSGTYVPFPQLIGKFSGGKIQHFAKGGFVDGPAGVDKVPAMLTAGEYVVPKDKAKQFKQNGGEIQNFAIGGMAKELNNENTENRAIRGGHGVAQLLVMNTVNEGVAKYLEKPQDDGPPTFDKNKFNNLDLRSDVNIKRGDPRLSARFLAKDPVMQEYKDYLLEKAAYDVEKKNQKVDKKMQTIGSVVTFMSTFAANQMLEVMKPYGRKAVEWAKDKAINTAKGHTGFGKHSDAFKQARKQGIDMDYSDLKGAESTGHLISNDNKAYNMSRDKAWRLDPEKTLSHRKNLKTKSIKRQSGGSIPAMLTAGEGFVPAPVAKRIGYDNLNRMNTTGGLPIVQGKGGIDNVGPVGLTEGDFIIKKSSTDKLLRENPNMMRFALQNPEGFKRGEQGYYEGGVVGSPSTIPAPSVPKQAPTSRLKSADPAEMLNQSFNQKQEAAVAPQQKSEVTNNINVNVSIDQTGKETVSTENSNSSYEEEQQLSLKIKSAVLDVIRQEKRIGGELSS